MGCRSPIPVTLAPSSTISRAPSGAGDVLKQSLTMKADKPGLLTDLYELTMAQAYY